MTPDAPYFADPELAPARYVQRAGRWTTALRLVPDTADGRSLRAEILVERHQWQLDDSAEALAAIKAIEDEDPVLASYLVIQIEYLRRLFKLDGQQLVEDPADALDPLLDDDRLGAWAVFTQATIFDNLQGESETAAAGFARANEIALENKDRFLESYTVRHLAARFPDQTIDMYRRSLNLRAGYGARPQTAAAQAILAQALGETPEADELRAIVKETAEDLDIAWLK